jgi:hypothetical protein
MNVETEQLLQDGGDPEHVYYNGTAWRCALFVGKIYGSLGYLQRNAAPCMVNIACRVKQFIIGFRSSRKGVQVSKTNIESVGWWRLPCWQRILCHRFPGTCETVGQMFKFVWGLHKK